MDLYAQIGVVLIIMTALSALILVFTQPAQMFTQGIATQSQTIEDRLATASGLDLAPFKNNINAGGTSLYPLIRDAKANKIAVLVQTKNQQGLVVNYGVQLRSTNNPFVSMSPYGYAGIGGAGGTDFEKNFVTTVRDVFQTDASPQNYTSGMVQPAAISKTYGNTAYFSGNMTNSSYLANLLPAGSPTPGATQSGQFYMAPHLMLADPAVADASKATSMGRTFSSSGLLYTDQSLKLDAPINDNFSYADSQGSMYRFSKSSSYYTTLISNGTGEIVGVYVEEHGVDPRGAVLAGAMLVNGTITQVY